MAHINIHTGWMPKSPVPEVEIASLPNCKVVRIDWRENESLTIFFKDEEEVASFVDRVSQALTAYLQSEEK